MSQGDLHTCWGPGLKVYEVLLSIVSLLARPDFVNPLVQRVAHMHKLKPERYEELVREHTQQHAIPGAPSSQPSLTLFEHAALALTSLKYAPEELYDRINHTRFLNAVDLLPIKRWRYPVEPQRPEQPGPAHGEGNAVVEREDDGERPAAQRQRAE